MLSVKKAILAPCLGAIVLAGACKKSDESAGPMPVPTKEAPADFPVDTGKRIDVPKDAGPSGAKNTAKGRPTLTDKDLIELKRSLPAIEGTRVIKALEATPHSRLARMALCSDLSVAEATASMVSAFKRKKWNDVTVSTPSNNKNHRSFSANLGRFRLNGTTTQGEFQDCKKSLKQSRVSWSLQERQPPAPTTEARQAKKTKLPLPKIDPSEALRLSPPIPATTEPTKPNKVETKSDLR